MRTPAFRYGEGMSKQTREGLGYLTVAAIALLVALLASGLDGDAREYGQSVGLVVGVVVGFVALVKIAVGLLRRPQRD
jgi:hypothetical protein